jgi:hypothetical protein
MTATLTDRYITATLRRVPEKQRPEIEKELRAAIADDVDGRIDEGAKPAAAEYATLKEMGDPYRLAASYAGNSLTLIGPDLYPTWVRSLKLVCWTSLPIVAVVLIAINFAQGRNFWASIFGPIGTIISVGIYLVFALTVVFAIAERTSPNGSDGTRRVAWTPDNLAIEIEPPSITKWGDALSQVVGTALIVAFLLIDRFAPFVKDRAGHAVSVLDPNLFAFWIPLYLVILGIAIVLELVKVRMRGWRVGTAIASTLLGLVGVTALIVTIMTTTVINPSLVTGPVVAAGSWMWWIIGIAIGVVWLGVTINLWRPSTRSARPTVPAR